MWRHNVHQDCQTATKKCRISQATILPSFMPFEKFFTSLWPMWKEKHLILTIVKVMWLSIHSHMLISVQKVSCSKTFRLVPSRYLCVFGTRGKIGIRLRRAGTDGKGRRKNATGRFFFFTKVQYENYVPILCVNIFFYGILFVWLLLRTLSLARMILGFSPTPYSFSNGPSLTVFPAWYQPVTIWKSV